MYKKKNGVRFFLRFFTHANKTESFVISSSSNTHTSVQFPCKTSHFLYSFPQQQYIELGFGLILFNIVYLLGGLLKYTQQHAQFETP
jgi:hypothetical protein